MARKEEEEKKIIYEKPELIDLKDRLLRESAHGACFNGSGDAQCINGGNATADCNFGIGF